jgi:hypothetical protein
LIKLALRMALDDAADDAGDLGCRVEVVELRGSMSEAMIDRCSAAPSESALLLNLLGAWAKLAKAGRRHLEGQRKVRNEGVAIRTDWDRISGIADRRAIDVEAHDVDAEVLAAQREPVEADRDIVGVAVFAEDF